MYIYDRQLTSRQNRHSEQPVTLLASRRYYYPGATQVLGGLWGDRLGQAPTPSTAPRPTSGTMFGALFQQIENLVRRGQEVVAIGLALSQGIRDENELTNLIFFARHKERERRPLRREEPQFEQLSREWLDIRDRLVKPAWRALASGRAQVATQAPKASPRGIAPKTLNNIARHDHLIDSIAARYNVDANIIRGIIAAESGGNPRSGEANPTGKKGLMQAGEDPNQLDPETSIRSGIEEFIRKRNTVARILRAFGIEPNTLDQETMLWYVMTAYNAGEGTLKKALEYAQAAGDKRAWEQPEHFQRALLFLGTYSVRAPLKWCLEKLSPNVAAHAVGNLTGIDPSRLIRDYYRTPQGWDITKIKKAFGKVIQGKLYREKEKLRRDDSLTLEKARQKASPLLMCSVEFKHTHRRPYIDKILRYKRHYDQVRRSAMR
jgi:Transglycosylase SLT domain